MNSGSNCEYHRTEFLCSDSLSNFKLHSTFKYLLSVRFCLEGCINYSSCKAHIVWEGTENTHYQL